MSLSSKANSVPPLPLKIFLTVCMEPIVSENPSSSPEYERKSKDVAYPFNVMLKYIR